MAIRGAEIEELIEETFFSLYEASPIRRRASPASRTRAERELPVAEERFGQFDARWQGEAGAGSERERLVHRVDEARARAVVLARSSLLASPGRLRRRWAGLSVVERRRTIGILIDAVILREDRGRGLEDRILVVPFGQGPDALPRPGQSSTPMPYAWADGVTRGEVAVLGPDHPPLVVT